MTPRRKALLLALVLIIGIPMTGIIQIGPVELGVWLLVLAAWLFAFIVWGGKTPHSRPAS